jgi:hypothetical protein
VRAKLPPHHDRGLGDQSENDERVRDEQPKPDVREVHRARGPEPEENADTENRPKNAHRPPPREIFTSPDPAVALDALIEQFERRVRARACAIVTSLKTARCSLWNLYESDGVSLRIAEERDDGAAGDLLGAHRTRCSELERFR